MKKIITLLLALALILGLAGCTGGPKPEDTVKAFIEGMQAYDFEAMQACLDGQTFEEGDLMEGDLGEIGSLYDHMKAAAGDIAYSIVNSNVNGDTATVAVNMEYTDLAPLTQEIFMEYFTKLFATMFTGSEDTDYEAVLNGIIEEKIAGSTPVRAQESFVFDLKKADKEWKIAEVPERIAVVLTGNLEKGIDDFSEAFSGSFEDEGWSSSVEPIDFPIENEVLFDNEYGRMTVVSGGIDEWGSTSFKVLCENKTADKSLTFNVYSVTVNGWVVSGWLNEEVAPGKSSTAELGIYDSTMEDLGIETPDKMELSVQLYDEDGWWNDEYLLEDTFTIYPTGLSEAQVLIPDAPDYGKHDVLVDDDILEFVILGEEEDDFYGLLLRGYVRNKSDRFIGVSWDDTSVNDCMVSCYFSAELLPGQQTLAHIAFDKDDFENNDIEEAEKIEFKMTVSDRVHWDEDPLLEETFVYEP